MRRFGFSLVLAVCILVGPAIAVADIQLGAPAPNFFKNKLGGGTVTLTDFPDKVIVLFLLGWD